MTTESTVKTLLASANPGVARGAFVKGTYNQSQNKQLRCKKLVRSNKNMINSNKNMINFSRN